MIVFSLNLPNTLLKGVSNSSIFRVIQVIRSSTYPGKSLYTKHTKPKGNEKLLRSEEFDLTGSRLIEVQLYFHEI